MTLIARLVLILLLGLLCLATLPQAAAQPVAVNGRPVVLLDTGYVAGSVAPGAFRFLGVPFASPPVRFDAPRAVAPWSGIYDASAWKPACVQSFTYEPVIHDGVKKWYDGSDPLAGESEDCLYLNVFVPARGRTADDKLKPVLFWLFGGGYMFGAASLPTYDGAIFAATQDVIIVSINYRTNVFGFPGSPDKPLAEQNLGFLDQRMALAWVQRNIAAFGGNPRRVTLFGESAGAASIDALITNPPRPVPFIGAILQSGQMSMSLPNQLSAESWVKLARAAGCDSGRGGLACMRAQSTDHLRDLMTREKLLFSPVRDGGVTNSGTGLRDRRGSSPWAPGPIARVPILIGTNADEGTVFAYGKPDPLPILAALLPPANASALAQKLLAAYPPNRNNFANGSGSSGSSSSSSDKNASDSDPIDRQLASILTDLSFNCPAQAVAADSAAVDIRTWRYYFDAGLVNARLFRGSGAWHSSEIPLVWGTYDRRIATRYQTALGNAMQDAWANFARDPLNGPGWGEPGVQTVAVLGAGVRPSADFADAGGEVVSSDDVDDDGDGDGNGDDNGGGGGGQQSLRRPRPVIALQNPDRIDRLCFLYKDLFDSIAAGTV